MKKLEQLPEIAARQLGGLEATPALLAKIKLKAAEECTPRKPAWKSVAALATAFVLLAVGAVSWQFLPKETSSGDGELMHTRSAGVEIRETEVPVTADLPSGSITLGDGRKGSSDSLFASADNGVFPMLIVNGATYRMLTYPDGISDGLLGNSLGTVNEYNVEPALGSGSIVSNSASQGETVYEIDGFSGALAAAKVNGSTRVFQRVSYAGTATIGNEGLNDTLCSASQVSWMTLEGVGTVEDADAQALMQTLLDNASYQSTGMSGSGSLHIGLTNGLTLQLLVGDDTVSACGTWSCPEFFESFHEAIGH